MNSVILCAGKATRLGFLAPEGCKSLVQIKGRTILDHQLDVLRRISDQVTVVCRSNHVPLLNGLGVDLVVHDLYDGPVAAFRKAKPQGDTCLCYGDSLFRSIPPDHDWVGVGFATGPRRWDVIERGHIKYEWVDEYAVKKVCVGVYRFDQPEKLWGKDMPDALHHYPEPLQFRVVPGWADAGDASAVKVLEGIGQ